MFSASNKVHIVCVALYLLKSNVYWYIEDVTCMCRVAQFLECQSLLKDGGTAFTWDRTPSNRRQLKQANSLTSWNAHPKTNELHVFSPTHRAIWESGKPQALLLRLRWALAAHQLWAADAFRWMDAVRIGVFFFWYFGAFVAEQ